MMETILNSLLTTAPIGAVLFFFTMKLWSRLVEKDKQIEMLYQDLRDLEKSNVEAMVKLSSAIEHLSELIKNMKK